MVQRTDDGVRQLDVISGFTAVDGVIQKTALHHRRSQRYPWKPRMQCSLIAVGGDENNAERKAKLIGSVNLSHCHYCEREIGDRIPLLPSTKLIEFSPPPPTRGKTLAEIQNIHPSAPGQVSTK